MPTSAPPSSPAPASMGPHCAIHGGSPMRRAGVRRACRRQRISRSPGGYGVCCPAGAMARIAQVYPHADIPLPHTRLYDALAIVNYEIGRRLARHHEVVTYPKWRPGQSELERHEGVTFRRIPEGIDRALNSLKVLDATGLLN